MDPTSTNYRVTRIEEDDESQGQLDVRIGGSEPGLSESSSKSLTNSSRSSTFVVAHTKAWKYL
jgi:hypothetical protein